MITDFIIGIVSTLVASLSIWLIAKKWESRRPRRPIEFTVERFVDDHWNVAFHETLPDTKAIDGVRMIGERAYAILIKKGAVDVGTTKLRIRLRTLVDSPVLIKQISIDTEKRAPLLGCNICCHTAGSSSATILVADLDEANPLVWEAKDEDFAITCVGEYPYFSRKSINITKNEYETLILVGKASRFCVSWRVRVEFETGGHLGFITIDSKGTPFRTTGEPLGGFASNLEWAWHDGHRIVPVTSYE